MLKITRILPGRVQDIRQFFLEFISGTRFFTLLLTTIPRSHNYCQLLLCDQWFYNRLAMINLVMKFYITDKEAASIVCRRTVIALMMSSSSNACVSKAAERKKALSGLKQAMITHSKVARLIPLFIALVNGCSPLFYE